MDRTQVLQASSSILNVLGVSPESVEYVQKQMASLLGVQDPNFYKEVEELWHEAYERKVMNDNANREVFASEAIVNGLKYVKDERFEIESAKLKKLKGKQRETASELKIAIAKAKAAQDEYLAGRKKA